MRVYSFQMEISQMYSWARDNPDFKNLMEETTWARYKSPYENCHIHMDRAREHIFDPRFPLSDEQRECLSDVLSGKLMPPK